MINWGIIGCGNVTEVKSGPAFNKIRDSRLIAVMRRDRLMAEDYARRHNVPKVYSDAKDLINDKDIDAVYIATPPGSHSGYALEVIKAGKPVYIEKPMAVSYAECQMINLAAKEHNVPVFVAYYRRALPGFLKVKELVETGMIGKVRFVKIELFKPATTEEKTGKPSWRVNPEIAGGGHFFDLASHQLDYLDYLFGPIAKTASVALNQAGLYDAEDMVAASFVFENGIAGSGIWCFSVSPELQRDSIEIIGDNGAINFSTFSFDPIIVTKENGIQKLENERPEHVQYFLIEKIVQELEGKGKSPSTGISAARTSRIMDEIVAEYYGGKDRRQKTEDQSQKKEERSKK